MWAMLTGRALFPWRRAFLGKFCRIVLPGGPQGFPDPAALGTVDAMERYIAGLHAILRLGVLGLFDLLNLLPLALGFFLPMMWLSDERAFRYLVRLERSRVYLIRNAFTGAKALAMLVYYGDPTVELRTGYVDDCLVPPHPEARS